MLRALAIATLLATAARGDVVTMAWDPNPESDIAGYRLHFGSQSGSYTRTFDCGNVARFSVEIDFDLTLRIGADRFSVVTAYNTSGLESFPSNEVDLGGERPSPPQGPKVVMSPGVASFYWDLPAGIWDVYVSEDLVSWHDLGRARDLFILAADRRLRHFARIEPAFD